MNFSDDMIRSTFKITALVIGVCLTAQALAGVGNDIPSCYAANKLQIAVPAPQTELFVVIDETTPLDPKLQDSVRENAGRLLQPGSSFVVASFSAFSQGRYLEVMSAGTLEAPVGASARDDISVKLLRTFDECMAGQLSFGRKAAATAINKAMAASTAELAKSDIMGSLAELSKRVKQSPAANKIVFLVSDMLENSSISSFYASNNVRIIDPAAEMKKARDAHFIGDFGGARVFVLGGALISETVAGHAQSSNVYRNPKAVEQLRQFWDAYFEASHAKLAEFGAPALVSPVQ